MKPLKICKSVYLWMLWILLYILNVKIKGFLLFFYCGNFRESTNQQKGLGGGRMNFISKVMIITLCTYFVLNFVVSSVCYVQCLLCLGYVLSHVCYVQGLLCLAFVMSSICYVYRQLCLVFAMSSVCYVLFLLYLVFV